MAKAQIRRTWPCGYQESVTISGWFFVPAAEEDDRSRPCPLHQWECGVR